jgi:glutamyl-tRNA synthetase
MSDRREAFAQLLRQRRLDPTDPRAELALELLADGHPPLAELAEEVAMLLRWEPRQGFAAPWSRRAIDALRAAIQEAPELNVEAAAFAVDRAVRLSGLGRQAFGHAARLALTGRSRGPDLARLIAVLGRDEAARRLDRALALRPVERLG